MVSPLISTLSFGRTTSPYCSSHTMTPWSVIVIVMTITLIDNLGTMHQHATTRAAAQPATLKTGFSARTWLTKAQGDRHATGTNPSSVMATGPRATVFLSATTAVVVGRIATTAEVTIWSTVVFTRRMAAWLRTITILVRRVVVTMSSSVNRLLREATTVPVPVTWGEATRIIVLLKGIQGVLVMEDVIGIVVSRMWIFSGRKCVGSAP